MYSKEVVNQKLTDAIATLGNDVNSIIATLNAHKIRGLPKNSFVCPVACYVTKNMQSLDVYDVRMVCVDGSNVCIPVDQYGAYPQIDLPQHVRDFISLFDNPVSRLTREDLSALELD